MAKAKVWHVMSGLLFQARYRCPSHTSAPPQPDPIQIRTASHLHPTPSKPRRQWIAAVGSNLSALPTRIFCSLEISTGWRGELGSRSPESEPSP
jgi:hypothetical protein